MKPNRSEVVNFVAVEKRLKGNVDPFELTHNRNLGLRWPGEALVLRVD